MIALADWGGSPSAWAMVDTKDHVFPRSMLRSCRATRTMVGPEQPGPNHAKDDLHPSVWLVSCGVLAVTGWWPASVCHD